VNAIVNLRGGGTVVEVLVVLVLVVLVGVLVVVVLDVVVLDVVVLDVVVEPVAAAELVEGSLVGRPVTAMVELVGDATRRIDRGAASTEAHAAPTNRSDAPMMIDRIGSSVAVRADATVDARGAPPDVGAGPHPPRDAIRYGPRHPHPTWRPTWNSSTNSRSARRSATP
jgi:hypothetical protein